MIPFSTAEMSTWHVVAQTERDAGRFLRLIAQAHSMHGVHDPTLNASFPFDSCFPQVWVTTNQEREGAQEVSDVVHSNDDGPLPSSLNFS